MLQCCDNYHHCITALQHAVRHYSIAELQHQKINMNLLQLSVTDFRQILREQLLWVMFIVAPTAQFALARWLVPVLIGYFPALDGYQPLFVGAFTLQVVTGIGFVVAMMLLDEKDDGVLSAIQVLPISSGTFIFYRLFMATLIGLVFAFAMLYFSGLISITFGQSLAGALLFAMISPAVTLFMSSFGDNKVEGLAMYKGINLVLLLPIASFFTPPQWRYLFGFIPDFWSFHYVQEVVTTQRFPWPELGVGLLIHGILIYTLLVQFRKRMFR